MLRWGVIIWEALRSLVGLFAKYGGPMVAQALLFFGVQFVAQSYVATPFVHLIEDALGGGPEMVIKAFAAIGFDKCVTIIISAYITAAAGRLVLRKRVAGP